MSTRKSHHSISTFKQLSPRSQNNSLTRVPKEESSSYRGQLQRISKENMPMVAGISHTSPAALKKTSQPSAKKHRFQPYILLPVLRHSPGSGAEAQPSPSRHAQTKNSHLPKGQDAVAAALFKQFIHNTATNLPPAPESPRRKQVPTVQQPSQPGPQSPSPAVTHDSAPDELLLVPELGADIGPAPPNLDIDISAGPGAPVTTATPVTGKVPEQQQHNATETLPSSVEEPGIRQPEASFTEQDTDFHTAELIQVDVDDTISDIEVGNLEEPFAHVYVGRPAAFKSAYYRRREIRFLDEALKAADEKSKSGVTRYTPPLEWRTLSRVPGRPPHVMRSETRLQRYTSILKELYGSGDIRRGNGRKPPKMRPAGEERLVLPNDIWATSGAEESDDAEDSRSDVSMSAPPITPPDLAMFSADGAPLLQTPVIFDPSEERPYVKEPIITTPALSLNKSLKPFPLEVGVPVTASKTSKIVQPALISDIVIPEPVPENSPEHIIPPNARWHSIDEWKRTFRKLVAGKNPVTVADLVDINNAISSLENMANSLSEKSTIMKIISGVAIYLAQMRDLPDGYMPFGDELSHLRKRAGDLLLAVYGENPVGTIS